MSYHPSEARRADLAKQIEGSRTFTTRLRTINPISRARIRYSHFHSLPTTVSHMADVPSRSIVSSRYLAKTCARP